MQRFELPMWMMRSEIGHQLEGIVRPSEGSEERMGGRRRGEKLGMLRLEYR